MPFFVVVGNLSRPGTALHMNLTCCCSFFAVFKLRVHELGRKMGERWDIVPETSGSNGRCNKYATCCVVERRADQTDPSLPRRY